MKLAITNQIHSIVEVETIKAVIVISPFDIAPRAVMKTDFEAAGDLLVGSAAGEYERLGIGASGSYLKVDPITGDIIWDPAAVQYPAPNVIINGDFDIWQRGTSFAAIATLGYSADRFKYYMVGTGVHTITKDTDVPTPEQSGHNSTSSLKIDCTTADAEIGAYDYSGIGYIIEGYDYAPLKGQSVTISFWVKATKTGTYCFAIKNSTGDRSYVSEYTINTTNTWEKKEVTIPLDQTGGTENYTNGVGIAMRWSLSCGSTRQSTPNEWQAGDYVATANQVNATDSTDNNFWLSQVKLELGSVATPFVSRPIAEELRLCQRYYEKNYPLGVAPGTNPSTDSIRYASAYSTSRLLGIGFMVRKRAAATVILWSRTGTANKVSNPASGADVGTTVTATGGETGFTGPSDSGSGFTAGAAYYFNYTADAEI